jgi:hypothetical protein
MTGPSTPKTTADAIRQQVHATRKRALSNKLACDDPIGARWELLEASDMERYAAEFLQLSPEHAEVGTGGEMVPTGEKTMDRPDLVDTVRSQPDLINARASVARLELVADTGALDLAVDVADTIKARNSLEKMLAHQIAAAHALAMRFAAKSEQLLANVTSWNSVPRQQVSSIEASRLANSAARIPARSKIGALGRGGGRGIERQPHTARSAEERQPPGQPIDSAEMWSEDAWRLAMSTTRNEEWPVPAPWGQEPWRAARIAKRELPSRLTYYRGHNTKAPRGGDTKSVRTTDRKSRQ